MESWYSNAVCNDNKQPSFSGQHTFLKCVETTTWKPLQEGYIEHPKH